MVLKPLCGAEPELYDSLRMSCEQTGTRMQIEFAGLDIEVLVDATQHGSRLEVSNLANMMRLAHRDRLVIADSDVRVPPEYLARVIAPLADLEVGVVTCLYRGLARHGAWSLG